ncbi:hypothetical protein [Fundicoccus culcitae]|uniref:MucBP domain-containing protein n=1 Tax=Fundicoccus culcitae TaxID=2969821 RepID=A0ABY5P7I1_9LACT|nr:hypothetical protein [Fundicoccus culcitae]UUX34688.1 hypothetical protein NRE15_03280 [Fundicoccus culcitae]
MQTKKRLVLIVITLFLLSLGIQPLKVNAQTSVNAVDYTPGLFYQFYDYSGEGNEYAPFTMTLDYIPDEQGIYQVSRATAGTTVSYVYQLTEEGIYELAYFPESYDQEDFRYHTDATDESKSLYFPLTLEVGATFSRGYQDMQDYVVTDILPVYNIEDIEYYNVVVIETTFDSGEIQRYYYAPKIGEIYSEYLMSDEMGGVTTWLNILRGPSYQ